jgi:dipeptidyl aminopeptidase/acylaminoacyl peptidase
MGVVAPDLIPFESYDPRPAQLTLRVSPSGKRIVWTTNVEGQPQKLQVADLDALDRPTTVDDAVDANEKIWGWWASDDRLLEQRYADETSSLLAIDLPEITHRTLATGERVSTFASTADQALVGIYGRSANRTPSASSVPAGAPAAIELTVTARRPPKRTEMRMVSIDLGTGDSTERWRGRPFDWVYADEELNPALAIGNWVSTYRYDGQPDTIWRRGWAFRILPDNRYSWLYTLRDPEVSGSRFLGFAYDDLWLIRSTAPGVSSLVRLDPATRASTTVLQSTADLYRAWLTRDGRVAGVVADDDVHRPWYDAAEWTRAHDRFAAASGGDVVEAWQQGSRWLAWIEGPAPSSLWTIDPDTHRVDRVGPSNGPFDRIDWRPTEPVRFDARDGLPLTAYVTRPNPAIAGPGPWPLVLVVHGGPNSRDSLVWRPDVQRYADLGYAVMAINFRGSTGFGRAFAEASYGQWGGAMQDDLLDGVRWAVDHGVADPARVAITGSSYGGYATLEAMTTAPAAFACGVAGAAPGVLYGPRAKLDPESEGEGEPVDIGPRKQRIAASPLTHVDALARPLLVWHGDEDKVIPSVAAEGFVRAADALGKPITYVEYPRARHGFPRPADEWAEWVVEARFLQGCLGGRAESWDALPRDADLRVTVGADRLDGLADALAARTSPP